MFLKKITWRVLFCCATFPFVLNGCRQQADVKRTPVQVDSLATTDKNPYVTYDQSPMDMSYYPVNYPLLKMNKQDSTGLIARVIYSRPHKKNRTIFSYSPQSLCQYGKEWRLGANEATEIDFFRNVIIGGKTVSKGTYVIYCIPAPDKWTIVLNSNLYTWGLHTDTTKDILRTIVPVQRQSPALEDFTMVFMDAPEGAELLMAWDNVKTVLPINFSKKSIVNSQ
jgi:hypothetical protein